MGKLLRDPRGQAHYDVHPSSTRVSFVCAGILGRAPESRAQMMLVPPGSPGIAPSSSSTLSRLPRGWQGLQTLRATWPKGTTWCAPCQGLWMVSGEGGAEELREDPRSPGEEGQPGHGQGQRVLHLETKQHQNAQHSLLYLSQEGRFPEGHPWRGLSWIAPARGLMRQLTYLYLSIPPRRPG